MFTTIPLIFDGDSYEIHVRETSPSSVLLVSVSRYVGNQNVVPTEESIMHLAQSLRRKIVQQINKRFPGRTITVEC